MVVSKISVWAGRSLIPVLTALFAVSFFINIQSLNADAVRYPNVIIPVTLGLVALNLLAEGRTVSDYQRAALRNPRVALGAFLLAPLSIVRPVLVVGLVAAFSYAIPRAGFYPSAVVFLFVTPWALGMRSLKVSVALGLGVGSCVYLLFEIVLGLSLPQRGW